MSAIINKTHCVSRAKRVETYHNKYQYYGKKAQGKEGQEDEEAPIVQCARMCAGAREPRYPAALSFAIAITLYLR